MNHLIRWLVGERVGRAFRAHGFARGNALWGLFLWWAVGWLGATAAFYNLGKAWVLLGCIGAMGGTLLLCLRRPLASGVKQAMLNAIGYSARWVMAISAGYVALRIVCAAIYGELQAQGLAGLPWQSLQFASLLFVAGGSVAIAVSGIFAADRLRLEREGKARLRWREAERQASNRAEAAAPPPIVAEDAWWVVLEVSPEATRADVEAKARALLKQYHPDRWVSAPRHLKAQAEHQTIRILQARAAGRAARKADCPA
ncbi:J domain-containing protein [Sphingomonas sp. 22176]|uniref:J domain-containing protein n=1 Tax=Sphingomonas sp. 22176 TaxID=3453884 RepID=UPI003F826490